ncbi:serine/threonine-protein kinase 11-interacting protein-like isoform X2 [Patiria miniata]|uniref:Serine/threonine-protein kinase 11-interacting protein n=1 Tax=Patiria miniata TaxID=46514 RepID=A0A913Z0E5_PATMI|nr:serine/threonine-protein kinase 11-interacting protein-like isoform X2 [Patiria miniata]
MQATNSLQELTVFLQKNSGKILNGRCNLALTSHTLAHLNRSFRQCEEESSVDSGSHDQHQSHDRRWPQTVMFLLNYVKKTPALKLIHPTSTLQGQVEISRFIGLTMLEIKKVPVHMLNGLGCLRHQLQVLICSRCVQSLQLLLCSCGGDMVSEAPWSSLHTLNLSYNYIDHLDNSLRLLPVLKMLDLSHNELKHTRDYLECLSELAHLNLGYNHLERVPTLGLVARTNLQTLVLRNNSLDNLSGLEDYSSLLELDLCNNCLYDGAELRTLGYLHNLREVNLLGNPLAFDPAYRSVVISKFPPEGATRKQIPRVGLTKPVLRVPSEASFDTSSTFLNDHSSFDESTDLDKGKRSKGKRAPKVRQVSIPDQGVHKDDAKSKASVLRHSDIEKTKREHEKMRQLHGADWLLALQAPYRQSGADTSESETEKIVERTRDEPKANRDNSLGPCSSGIESDIDSTINGNIIVHASADGSRHVDNIDNTKNDNQGIMEEISAVPSSDVFLPEVKADLKRVSTGQTHVLLEQKNSKPSIFLERIASDSDAAFESPWIEGTPEEEEHELCSPLLVTVQESNQDDPVHLFLTVRETHLEEKNLNGHVTERLEIKCLKGMQESIEPVWNEEAGVNDLLPVINLTFDYMRRDRKKREYILEDQESFRILSKTLRPFLEENRLAATTHQKAMFQCLKCSTEFAGHQAKRKLPAQQGTIRGNYNSEGEGNGVCPFCDSELIVELENPASPSNHTSIVSTPTGSLNSLEMNLRPMASSSPWKVKDKDSVLLSSTEKSRSGSSTEYHSAANSLSSSPGQGMTFGQAISSSSSGTSTLVNSSSLIATSTIKRERHITEESIEDNGSAMSATSDQDTAQESNFALPDPTIRMSRGDETNPLENISTYQHEKLRELLQENMAPFSQKYSLVPPDILDGVSSREVSGATTPRSGETSNPPSRNEIDNAVNSPAERIDNDKTSQPQEDRMRTKSKSNSSTTLKQHRNDTPDKIQNRGSRPCSEDDIVILPAEKSNHERLEVSFNGSNDSTQDTPSYDTVSGVGRAGSTDSEIAVLRNNSIDAVSINSDSVFDTSLNAAPTNLANALSDAASKPDATNSSLTPTIDEPHAEIETSGVPSRDVGEKTKHENLDRNGRKSPTNKPSSQKTSPSKESSLNSSLEASVSLSMPRKHSMLEAIDSDFTNVDHRLKLYFSMSLFSGKEELACMIKCGIFQFSKSANFSGLLVVSTQNIYIMRISREESEKPSDWLAKRSQHSVRDLLHIHVGPGSQSFQLDFNNEGILYTIVLRDEEMCEAFVSQLEKAIQRAPIGKKRRFKGVARDHPNTLMNIMSQVFGESMDEGVLERESEISLYMLAYQKTTKSVKRGLLRLDRKISSSAPKTMALDLVPVSIVVTPSDLYLAEENHWWPLRQTKTKGQTKLPQFTLKDHHTITDVGEVELYEDSPSDISITFFHEDTADQSHWHISTENTSSLSRLLDAIQTPWKDMFGVDLKQTVHPTLTVEEEFLD